MPLDNTKLLKELKELIADKLKHQIDKIILFGSQINGKAEKYSDYGWFNKNFIANESIDKQFGKTAILN